MLMSFLFYINSEDSLTHICFEKNLSVGENLLLDGGSTEDEKGKTKSPLGRRRATVEDFINEVAESFLRVKETKKRRV